MFTGQRSDAPRRATGNSVRAHESRNLLLLAAAAGVVFAIDALLPLGITIGIFQVPLVVAAWLLTSPRSAVALTVVALMLMALELLVTVDAADPNVRRLAIVNRALSMAMVCGTSGLMYPLTRARAALAASERERSVAQESLRQTEVRAEAALMESEQRFRSFMDNNPALAFMKNARGEYVYANQPWRDCLLPTNRPFDRPTDFDLFPSDHAALLIENDRRVLESGQPWEGQEETLTVNRGLRHWLVCKFPFTSLSGEQFLGGVAFDITPRIEAQNEVRRLNAELEDRVRRRTAELEAVNQELEAFTYSVSHDLRAPLRGMSGFARMLEEDYGQLLDQNGRRYVKVIQDNARQMGQLIDDLLALSRLGRQPLKKAVVSMEQLAREAFAKAAAQEPDREIEFTADSLPDCRIDPSLLHQALFNLFSNAIKFTRRSSPARIRIGQRQASGEAVYFVEDNGAGFDMRYADKLFGVFQRLHSADQFEGTGVGLAIVKRVIERHGGRVWAESAPDRGATFFFTLGPECHAQ